MHFSVMKHIFLLKHPGFDISAKISLNEAGARKHWEIAHFVFGQPGKRQGTTELTPDANNSVLSRRYLRLR